MDNEKYTIAEEFDLPSGGKIYDKPVNARVKLRAMTMRDEMKRTARTDRPNIVLADIIEDCMIEKPAIHVADMHIGDVEFLLHKLRVVSQGETYPLVCVCPFCGNVEDITINLDKEEVIDFKADDFEDLLKVILPVSGKEVKLKFHTPRIIDGIKLKADELKKKSKGNDLDFEKFVLFQESIDTVDGSKLTYTQKENFINNLHIKDANKIKNRIDKINSVLGLKSEIRYTCGKCGEEVLTFFRYTSEFFNPADND